MVYYFKTRLSTKIYSVLKYNIMAEQITSPAVNLLSGALCQIVEKGFLFLILRPDNTEIYIVYAGGPAFLRRL
jgi:hypothetical protein